MALIRIEYAIAKKITTSADKAIILHRSIFVLLFIYSILNRRQMRFCIHLSP
ncbi:hypothetical protein K2Y11_20695 [bacterium]|nr:hypothetical protein [bacterium]